MQHTEKKTKTVIKVSWCKLFYINNITLQRKKDKYFNAAREKSNKSFPCNCKISGLLPKHTSPAHGRSLQRDLSVRGRQAARAHSRFKALRLWEQFSPQKDAAVSPCLGPYQTEHPAFSIKKDSEGPSVWCTLTCKSQHPKSQGEKGVHELKVWLAIRNNLIVLF